MRERAWTTSTDCDLKTSRSDQVQRSVAGDFFPTGSVTCSAAFADELLDHPSAAADDNRAMAGRDEAPADFERAAFNAARVELGDDLNDREPSCRHPCLPPCTSRAARAGPGVTHLCGGACSRKPGKLVNPRRRRVSECVCV